MPLSSPDLDLEPSTSIFQVALMEDCNCLNVTFFALFIPCPGVNTSSTAQPQLIVTLGKGHSDSSKANGV